MAEEQSPLLPTKSSVGNQKQTLKRRHPVVFCRSKIPTRATEATICKELRWVHVPGVDTGGICVETLGKMSHVEPQTSSSIDVGLIE